MEIDVWTSATVIDAQQEISGKWAVTVQRGDTNRVVHVDHVIFAIGVGGGTPNMPSIPGMVRLRTMELLAVLDLMNMFRTSSKGRYYTPVNTAKRWTTQARRLSSSAHALQVGAIVVPLIQQ